MLSTVFRVFFACVITTGTVVSQDTLVLAAVLDTVCAPEGTITARPEGETYAWSTGQTTRSIAVAAGGPYVATVTAANGDVTIDEHRVTVETVPNPVPITVLTPEPFCPGDTVELFADLAGFDTIRWVDGVGGTYPPVPGDPRRLRLPFTPGLAVTYDAEYVRCRERLTTFPPYRFTEEQTDDRAFSGELLVDPREGLCPGDTVRLEVTAANDGAVRWSDGVTGPRRSLVFTETQTLAAYVTVGCGPPDTLTARLDPAADCNPPDPPLADCQTRFPELISPNGDGVNDLFRLFTDCPVSNYYLRLFNRWGQPVFTTTDPTAAWDGTTDGVPQAAGLYLYVAQVEVVGLTARQHSGEVLVLR